MAPDGHYNLALETSGPLGSVALGRGDALLGSAALAQAARAGHRVELMAVVADLCQQHAVTPAQLDEVYVSIGPGSFTGLRISITTAKLLARTLGVKLLAIPTLEVVAQNVAAPASQPVPNDREPRAWAPYLAVCLNLKRDTVYAGVFTHDGSRWAAADEARLSTMDELLDSAPRPLRIVGDPLPALSEREAGDAQVERLPPDLALPHAEALWRLGRARRAAGAPTIDPLELLPLYVRPPEAVELWERRRRGEG